MRQFTFLFVSLLCATLSVTTVAAGRVAGNIDGTAFEAPVECSSPMENMFQARTAGMALAGSSKSDVVPAADITVWGGRLAVTAFVADKRYQFGATNVDVPKGSLSYEGTIRSRKHGDYEVSFTVECAP